ncbi:MAG: sensor histidine kinase [Bacillota bacterium]
MGSSIKKRIRVGYGVVVAILVGVATWSGVNFWRLRLALRDVLVENYRSVVAAESMIAALERQDSGVLLYVAGEAATGEPIVAASQADFYTWFARATDNITIPGEQEILAKIDQEYKRYSDGYLTVRELVATQGRDVARKEYLESELPVFTRIRQLCADLQAINQENMMHADQVAERAAQGATVSVTGVAIVATVFAVAFATRTLSGVIGSLDSLVKGLSDGIVVTDSDFRIEMLNSVAERILNVTGKDAIGKHLLEVLDDQAVFAAIKRLASERKAPRADETADAPVILESRTRWQNREEQRFHAVGASPIRTQQGALTGVVVVFNDITKYKELDEIRSQFVATVAHEFRTPLTSITMSVGLLLEQEALRNDPKARPLLDIIQDDSSRLARMVSELLDLARIQAGKIEVRRVPVSAQDLIEEALRPLRQQSKDLGIQLSTDVEGDCVVRADPDKIVWVISNLVGNALRYTPKGGTVTVGARKAGEQKVEIYVRDTGQGIAPEDQTRIFHRFVQVKGSRVQTLPGGAGLGLAISKEIVEAHEGRIWVESQPGQGSTFVFTLQRGDKVVS